MSKLALVVGCSGAVWDDVRVAQKLTTFDKIYCVKQIGTQWPGEFVWVTLHPEFMDAYELQRKQNGLSGAYEIVAPLKKEVGDHHSKGNVTRRVSYLWPDMTASAASGIYGAKVAMDDGYRVVLAGIPMLADAGHFMPTTRNGQGFVRGNVWTQMGNFEKGFRQAVPYMCGKVKSVSGRTKDILGEPTPEWLAATSEKADGAEGSIAQK